MPHRIRWAAKYLNLNVRIWQEGHKKFNILVSDGVLTHIHVVSDCDAEAARTAAARLVGAFVRRGVASVDVEPPPPVLEWTPEGTGAFKHNQDGRGAGV